jgi:drug/metabolite transporter superfamily protein YnfA
MDTGRSPFEQAATQQSERPLVYELWAFLRENRKWWLAPIVVTLLLFGVVLALSGSAAAPFIYTLF